MCDTSRWQAQCIRVVVLRSYSHADTLSRDCAQRQIMPSPTPPSGGGVHGRRTKARKQNRQKTKLGLPDLGCGLRRRELIDLSFDHIQRREDHWAIDGLVGKGGHIRTVPMPAWVKHTIDDWQSVAELTHGRIFRCVCRRGVVWGTKITEKVVWHVVKEYAERLGISKLAPHDLRRSCARLCHESGGELEQIQF